MRLPGRHAVGQVPGGGVPIDGGQRRRGLVVARRASPELLGEGLQTQLCKRLVVDREEVEVEVSLPCCALLLVVVVE